MKKEYREIIEAKVKAYLILLNTIKHSPYLYQKNMGLIKLFSGDEILALSLQEKIEAIGITTVIRNNNQANVLPSINNQKPVELFIQEVDYGKASPIIEEFRLSL